jgi:hypothetical protein
VDGRLKANQIIHLSRKEVEIMSMKDKARREDTEDLVREYFNIHPLAKEIGGEYIYQNDKAQVDAIQLVSDICDLYFETE